LPANNFINFNLNSHRHNEIKCKLAEMTSNIKLPFLNTFLYKCLVLSPLLLVVSACDGGLPPKSEHIEVVEKEAVKSQVENLSAGHSNEAVKRVVMPEIQSGKENPELTREFIDDETNTDTVSDEGESQYDVTPIDGVISENAQIAIDTMNGINIPNPNTRPISQELQKAVNAIDAHDYDNNFNDF